MFIPLKIVFFFFSIGVTLVNKIVQVSGAQLHNTSPVYCIVCSPPKVKSSSITIYSPLYPHLPLPPSFPSGNQHTDVCLYKASLSLIPSLFSTSLPTPLLPTAVHLSSVSHNGFKFLPPKFVLADELVLYLLLDNIKPT